jgi:hypothetical protein
MRPLELIRTVRELEAHTRRMYRLIERLGVELDHATDEVSRVRRCVDQLVERSPRPTPVPASPSRSADGVTPRAPRRAPLASAADDPAPRVILKMQLIPHVDGSAMLVLGGEQPGDTRRVRLSAAPAELFRLLAADDGRPRLGDCVSAKPRSELQRKLHTRTGRPLTAGALKQRVSVLRRRLVERGFLHPAVLSGVTLGGEPGYHLALRHR